MYSLIKQVYKFEVIIVIDNNNDEETKITNEDQIIGGLEDYFNSKRITNNLITYKSGGLLLPNDNRSLKELDKRLLDEMLKDEDEEEKWNLIDENITEDSIGKEILFLYEDKIYGGYFMPPNDEDINYVINEPDDNGEIKETLKKDATHWRYAPKHPNF